MKFVVLLMIFFLVSLMKEAAIAIKCWECKSEYDPHCADPFSMERFALTDCSLKLPPVIIPDVRSNFCRRIKQEVNGKLYYIRGCGFLKEPNATIGECRTHARNNISLRYCTCDNEDGCNS